MSDSVDSLMNGSISIPTANLNNLLNKFGCAFPQENNSISAEAPAVCKRKVAALSSKKNARIQKEPGQASLRLR